MLDGCITIMPDGQEIDWTVSETIAKCGKEFITLESPDQRFAICGEYDNLTSYAYSILAAVAAKKLTEVTPDGQ